MSNSSHANAIVPEGNVVILPLEPNMNLLSRGDQFVQIVHDRIGFCFGNSNYIRDETYEHSESTFLVRGEEPE